MYIHTKDKTISHLAYLSIANHAALQRSVHTLGHTTHTFEWTPGHACTSYLPPSLPLPTPALHYRLHAMHACSYSSLGQDIQKVQETSFPFFTVEWSLQRSTGGGPGPLGEAWQSQSRCCAVTLWGVCEPMLTSQLHCRDLGVDGVDPEGFFLGSQSLSAFSFIKPMFQGNFVKNSQQTDPCLASHMEVTVLGGAGEPGLDCLLSPCQGGTRVCGIRVCVQQGLRGTPGGGCCA